MFYLEWGVFDLRDEFAKFEREHRVWPRSRSCSKPLAKRPRTYQAAVDMAKEEFERWHVIRMLRVKA